MSATTKNPEVVAVLRAALALIKDRRRWTVRAWARDRNSRPMGANDKRAVRWCASGALYKVTTPEIYCVARAQLQAAAMEVDGHVECVNDRGHRATMGMYRRAIELAEADA